MSGFVDLAPLQFALGERRVRAYVPPRGRARHGCARPLLVMFDGQNLFGDRESFAGGWHVHEALDRFARARRSPAPIVVAIDNGGTARIDELAPLRDEQHGGGQLPAFVSAIVDELLPRLARQFDVIDASSARFIGGSSLGGLAALYAHLVYPHVFGGALAMSPSLWFTRARVAALLHAQPRPAWSRIYLDCGAREGEAMWPAIEAFARRLRRRRWHDVPSRDDRRLLVRLDSRGKHHEAAWRRRFPRALQFLLAR